MSKAIIIVEIHVDGDPGAIVDCAEDLKDGIVDHLKRYPITHEGVHITTRNTFKEDLL